MRKTFFFVATSVVCVTAVALAQSGRPGGVHPIADALRTTWAGAKKNILESADLMPEADYGFKPVDSVRTFGAVLAHVAGASYEYCSSVKGEKSPHAEDAFETSVTTKAAIIKVLGEALKYCDGAFASFDDRELGNMINMPFGMPRAPRVSALLGNIEHLNEHYGNLVTYFRIKGIVPPSSRR